MMKKIDYEEKMRIMVKHFETIVDQVSKKPFKIKIPSNYNVNMSDYNDFYHVTE